MGRENDSLERILPKLIEKDNIFYEEQSGNIYFIKDLIELPEIKNKTIFFQGDWNLYHIILETSPGLLLINDIDYKINLSYSSEQNINIVEALGNPYIITTDIFSFKQFNELNLPSLILENNAHFPNIELMNKTIKKLQRNFSEKAKVKPLGKKIYVSRSDAFRRKVLNEEELMRSLEKRGFQMVIPGKYNVADQSKLFEDAEIIIGPHGLGLVNMLFSNNLKTVIELFTITHAPNCYLRTAQIKGVKIIMGYSMIQRILLQLVGLLIIMLISPRFLKYWMSYKNRFNKI
jgi:capsular polysaccharide biosynthesis protein